MLSLLLMLDPLPVNFAAMGSKIPISNRSITPFFIVTDALMPFNSLICAWLNFICHWSKEPSQFFVLNLSSQVP